MVGGGIGGRAATAVSVSGAAISGSGNWNNVAWGTALLCVGYSEDEAAVLNLRLLDPAVEERETGLEPEESACTPESELNLRACVALAETRDSYPES